MNGPVDGVGGGVLEWNRIFSIAKTNMSDQFQWAIPLRHVILILCSRSRIKNSRAFPEILYLIIFLDCIGAASMDSFTELPAVGTWYRMCRKGSEMNRSNDRYSDHGSTCSRSATEVTALDLGVPSDLLCRINCCSRPGRVWFTETLGARAIIASPGVGMSMDHVTVLESITERTVFGANGSQIGGPRLSYRVMDSFNGGSFRNISLRNALGALIIR